MSESFAARCPGLSRSRATNKERWRDRLLRFFLSYGLVVPQCGSWTRKVCQAARKKSHARLWSNEFVKSCKETEHEYGWNTAANYR
jgi:hypothetical protein